MKIWNCNMLQGMYFYFIILIFSTSSISTTDALALYSRQQLLPLLYSKVFAEQQTSQLLNIKQVNLHSNIIEDTAVNNGTATTNNTSLKSKAVNTALADGNI